MKNVKKLFALLLAVVIVLSLSVTAFAADPTGTITVENATGGKTYAGYKIFDATYNEKTGAVSYTIKDNSPWYATVAAATNVFTLNEVKALEETVGTGGDAVTVKTYNVVIKSDADPKDILAVFFTKDADDEQGRYTITLPAGVTAADLAAQTPSVDGTVTWTAPYGYYIITSTLGSYVTVDTNTPNVTIIDKNQDNSWDNDPDPEDEKPAPGKVIIDTVPHCGLEESDGEGGHKHTTSCYQTTVNSVNYGESVNFDIGVNATNYVGTEKVTYYYINDRIGNGFKYDLTGNPAGFHPTVIVGDETLTEGTDYVIKMDSDGQGFEIIITWADIEYATGEGENATTKITKITSLYDSNNEIHVTYSATINADGEDVVIDGDGNPNTANYTCNTNKVDDPIPTPPDPENPGDPPVPPTPPETPNKPYEDSNKKTTTTYVYAAAIEKVDEDEAPLAGAKFSVKDADGNTIYAIPTGVPGEYEYALSTATGAVSVFDTDGNGYLVIKGLEKGNYFFTEEIAPDGYNPLTEAAKVEAACIGEETTTVTTTYYYDKVGNLIKTEEETNTTNEDNFDSLAAYMVKVQNLPGTPLPSTGGIGTTIFYVFGGILLVGAAVLLITKKRMSANG